MSKLIFLGFLNYRFHFVRKLTTLNSELIKVMCETESHRLTRDVFPRNYKLTLIPNFDNWTFQGSESIELEIKKQTYQVILNSCDIEIQEAKINNESANISYNKEMERAILSFSSQIDVGCCNLDVKFTGCLNEDMKGFYRSTYTNDEGAEVKMAVTQFEPSDARRAYPCFDEPNFKATYDVTLIVPSNKVALSNMPVKSQKEMKDNLVKYDYETTPLMSSYLLAFVIGEMDYVETSDINGVKIRVYTAKNKSDRGKFAMDVCSKTLPFYADYFGIQYPLPKMDLVAIPDFAAGAMENWGLVTYREAMLLVDENESSAMSRQVVALVVGHECAHMWFGNLVTMDWWTDLWLNEGFATWIEYLCVDYCYPEFDIWTNFASSEYARALDLDSLESSHPIEVTVHKPSEIDEIFDSISYSKGATIIRMLNEYLTNEKFKRGLAKYLQKHKYSNTVTVDLWQALSEESGIDVGSMMETWTKQTGFPVINVESIQDGHGNTTHVKLQQKRFLTHGKLQSPEQHWIVPVTICSMDNPNVPIHSVIMERHGQPQTFQLPQPVNGFVKINPNAVGFYHTQYQETVLPSLVQLLTKGKLSPRDRLSLVVDQFALARSGVISISNTLDIVRGYKMEVNFTVWSSLLSNLRIIGSLIDEMDSTLTSNYERFLLDLVEPTFNFLGGWNEKAGEGHNEKMLRPVLLRVMAKCGQKDVITEAQRRFEKHYSQQIRSLGDSAEPGSLIPADLRSAVYSTVLKYGTEETLDRMLELYRHAELSEERNRIMSSLGSVPHNLIYRVHEFAFTDEVRRQDKYRVLLSTVRDAKSRSIFWDYFITNWPEFKKNLNNHMLGFTVKVAFEDFVTEERRCQVKQFFENNPVEFKRNVEQTLENIMINIDILSRDGSTLRQFFNEY